LGGDVVGGDILENFGENTGKIFCKKIERGKIKKFQIGRPGSSARFTCGYTGRGSDGCKGCEIK
jgi:hypothetical protein